MSKVLVTLYPWESPKLYTSEFELEKGALVIVAGEHSNEIGVVEAVGIESKEDPSEKIIRIATERDSSVYKKHVGQREELIEACKNEVKKTGLEMKVIDVMISLDGKQILFAFTADGRVDFRDLVKTLSTRFKKSIRMQQVGSRDEAKKLGGYGICGREICCLRFGGPMQSITTDMARLQQIANRGADRISGLCGRLMCCLAYEAEQYRELLKGMPELYSSVKTKEGKGTVIEINAPLQEIKVKLETGKYISVKKEDIK
ncbi:MAG TPA: stage 0 sporulation protein [Candidatus Moranbacteria bacterium]|nr:stage 0 sporulation protein [Candidatus Moranbacteria bacterium]